MYLLPSLVNMPKTMEATFNKQIVDLFNTLGLEMLDTESVSDVLFLTGSIEIVTRPKKKSLTKHLSVSVSNMDTHELPCLRATLRIQFISVEIFANQHFETLEDLEKLLMNNPLIRHIIEHKAF